jgi:hypothetical protein
VLEPMTPRGEQEQALQKMIANQSGATLLAAKMGTGKTLIGVEYVKRMGAQTVLLIGPLQTMGAALKEDDIRHHGWWGTFDRQQVGLKFRQIDSSVAGKAALADLQWSVPGVYFVGQEMFVRMGWESVQQFERNGEPKRRWNAKEREYQDVWVDTRTSTWDFAVDVMIFDEVHRAANGGSQTFKTLMGFGNSHKGAPRVTMQKIGASGTYEGNSFDGAWAPTRWLWPHIIDASIFNWRQRFAKVEYDHFAVRNQRVIGELNPGAFVASLPCYIYMEADFGVAVESKEFFVDLPFEQRKVYDDLEDRMVAWIKDNPMVTKYPITKRIRQRQVTLALPSLTELENGDFDVTFDDDCMSVKIDDPENGVYSILEGFFENESALIFTDSQQFARVLTSRLNARYGDDTAREWSGKVKRAVRDADKLDFIAGKYKYFVAVIKASGTGTDSLQYGSRNMLYVSSDDSRIEGEQATARLVRDGQKLDVRVARILARETEDVGQRSKHIEDALAANKRAKAKR